MQENSENSCIIIEDIRIKFKGTTFSNYKKSLVIKKMIHAMYYQKLEEAFFWTSELMCTHLYLDIWNTFFMFMSKYIHVYNPKLPIFMNRKFKEFKEIAYETSDDYKLRNDSRIRSLICSITLILCLSNKYTILDDLNNKFNFKVENIYENLKAPNLTYINKYYLQHDPKEYIIPYNELIYHLVVSKNKIDINYWINWIIHYDSLCNSKKKYVLCQQRDIYMCKNERQSMNIIWILWDVLLKLSEKKGKMVHEITKQLFDLFSVKYTISFNKKRKYLIYNAVELYLHNNIDYDIPILKNTKSLENLDKNINVIFEQLKKNEILHIEDPEEAKNYGIKPKEEKTSKLQEKMQIYQDIYNNL